MSGNREDRFSGGDPPFLVDDRNIDAESSRSTAWALDLLRAATPYSHPIGRKQRVQLQLGARVRRHVPWLLRPVVIGALLVGSGAIATAALGGWPAWVTRVTRAFDRISGTTRTEAPAASARSHRALAASTTSRAEAEPPVEDVRITPPPPQVQPARRRGVGVGVREDMSPLLDAMRALRIDHDPVRARALLAAYLARHPRGGLAEEALAMSIEAAVAHRDADAPELGARYLKLYPSGPFARLARQTLGAEPSGDLH